MIELLRQLLAIPSPTFKEQEIVRFLKKWMHENFTDITITEFKDSIICHFPWTEGKPHISLVGHSDVVPEFFEPYFEGDKLYGSGGSDMTGALAAYMHLMKLKQKEVLNNFNISILIYSREEGTKVEENGLYDLINEYPDYFKSVDLAIVGEPTDNTIQIGCVGSTHAEVIVRGVACHSARPWNGENAIYKALPLIDAFAQTKEESHTLFGVDFFDVMQITESYSEAGRTSLPGYWRGNINFRFAPIYTVEEAEAKLTKKVEDLGLDGVEFRILDSSPCGSVIENDVFRDAVAKLALPVEAKQAWTDVAQLTALGVSAFNFGPGLTSQAHKKDEYILVSYMEEHYKALDAFLAAE